MIDIKNLSSLDDGVLSFSYGILFGDDWKKNWSPKHKAEEMKSIFTGHTQPCVPFENWVSCIEFLSYRDLNNNKKMGVTSPKDKSPDLSKLEEALEKFETEFEDEENGEDYYHLVIDGEYNKHVCNEIVKLYLTAGWRVVRCKTSSENGEKPGLTRLQLWR